MINDENALDQRYANQDWCWIKKPHINNNVEMNSQKYRYSYFDMKN